MNLLDQFKQVLHTLTGLGRQEDHGSIGHISQLGADLFLIFRLGAGFLFDQVPLVDGDNRGLAGFMCQTGDLGILIGDAGLGVDHQDTHVGALNGHLGAHDREPLHRLVHLALAADTGGVNKGIMLFAADDLAVDGVTGGAGYTADNDPLLAGDPVDQAGLAGVGLADDGNLDALVLLHIIPGILGQVSKAGIQQVAGAVAVEGGNAHRITQTQVVELIELSRGITGCIHLIDGQHDGLSGLFQHGGHFHIGGGNAGADVGDQNHHLGMIDGDQCLMAHKLQNFIVGFGLDTAGVHHHKGLVAPLGIAVNTVTGHAGSVLHDGVALLRNAVEQQGFTHIGSAYDGDHGFFHIINSLFFFLFSIVSVFFWKIKRNLLNFLKHF